jgi:hypothetical protein
MQQMHFEVHSSKNDCSTMRDMIEAPLVANESQRPYLSFYTTHADAIWEIAGCCGFL